MQLAEDQQQQINVSEDAVDDDDNMTEQANEQAEAGREHDRRTEAEHNSDEQAHAASVTEHSEERQTAGHSSTKVQNRQQQQSQRLTTKRGRTQLELLDQQVEL